MAAPAGFNLPLRLLLLLLLLLGGGAVAEKSGFTLAPELVRQVEEKYGEFAARRLLAWEKLIREDPGGSDRDKLERVNTFFNRIDFVDDIVHWREVDYWATPVEFLATGAGDCEDFAIAKYFTLRALGVAEEKLNITYVKAVRLNQAHMVLTYFTVAGAEPLVLDNLVATIEPATKRPDLLPVYSFNGSGLWLARARGQGQRVDGGQDRMKRWQDLLRRLPAGLN